METSLERVTDEMDRSLEFWIYSLKLGVEHLMRDDSAEQVNGIPDLWTTTDRICLASTGMWNELRAKH